MSDNTVQADKSFRSEVVLAFFNHVEGQVGLATNKTALLVAANAFLFAAYLTLLKDFHTEAPKGATTWWYFFVALAFLLLTAASFCSLWSVFPTRRPRPVDPKEQQPCAPSSEKDSPSQAERQAIENNLVFFGHVAAHEKRWKDYLLQFKAAGQDDLLTHILTQTHAKSYYLRRMFFWVQWGLALTMSSLVSFAVAAMMVIVTMAMK